MNPLCATRGVCCPGRDGVTGFRPGVRTDLPPGEAIGDRPGEARGDRAFGDLASGEAPEAAGDAARGEADRGVRAKIGDCDATDLGDPTGRRGPGVPGRAGLPGAEGLGDLGGLSPGPDMVPS